MAKKGEKKKILLSAGRVNEIIGKTAKTQVLFAKRTNTDHRTIQRYCADGVKSYAVVWMFLAIEQRPELLDIMEEVMRKHLASLTD